MVNKAQDKMTEERIGGVKVYRWLGLTLLALILDLWTKQLVVQHMALYQRIELMPFFNLYYVHNYGAAFSFLSDQGGWQRWFFSIVTCLISIGIAFWLTRLRANQRLLIIALTLVLGGALGNLYDRLVYGYVIDFIDWYVGDYHWPAFNIADAAISLGAILLILDSFINPEPEKSK